MKRLLVFVLLSGLAGCRPRAEIRLLSAAGVEASLSCKDGEGVERMSFCGTTLTSSEAAMVAKTLGFQPLRQPEKHGVVTNQLNLPFECQLLLFDNPRPMLLSGAFDAPYALHEPDTDVQYASVVLAQHPITGQSCFTFIRDFR